MDEILDFYANYSDKSIDMKTRYWWRIVTRCDQVESNSNILDVFSMNVGHTLSQDNIRYLGEQEFRVAHAYLLSNYDTQERYERYAFLRFINHCQIHNHLFFTCSILILS